MSVIDVCEIDEFIDVCEKGDKSEAKNMVERDPSLCNKQYRVGISVTGLMWALEYKQHSLSRWLLSIPGLDSNIRNGTNRTALHISCVWDAPLDVVITLVRLSSWDTVNMKDKAGMTALDWAADYNHTSAALYLSWLGAECEEENVRSTKVTLQTWIEAGCQQEAQYWAVAANDVEALKLLAGMENVTLDKENIRSLAKIFDHRTIWSYVTSLQSLAWEKLQQSSPAVVTLSPKELMEKNVPDHVVRVLLMYRDPEENEDASSPAKGEDSIE